MQTYIGTKIVNARPMPKRLFELNAGKTFSNLSEDEAGYEVTYEDGYVSWSPKEVFERCYRIVAEAEKKLFSPSELKDDWCVEYDVSLVDKLVEFAKTFGHRVIPGSVKYFGKLNDNIYFADKVFGVLITSEQFQQILKNNEAVSNKSE